MTCEHWPQPGITHTGGSGVKGQEKRDLKEAFAKLPPEYKHLESYQNGYIRKYPGFNLFIYTGPTPAQD